MLLAMMEASERQKTNKELSCSSSEKICVYKIPRLSRRRTKTA